jgi:beta-xylosidase
MPGIDPALFFDGDGKAYLLTNGRKRIIHGAGRP